MTTPTPPHASNAFNASNAPKLPLEDLYQEVILDHNRRPRNFKALEPCTAHCHAYNPLCGDDYDIFVSLDAAGVVQDIAFTGKGCAISKASGSMMTAKVKGKSVEEARRIKEAFLGLVTRDEPVSAETEAALGSLSIFRGVKKYPIRVKCATLVWHALEEVFQKIKPTAPGGAHV